MTTGIAQPTMRVRASGGVARCAPQRPARNPDGPATMAPYVIQPFLGNGQFSDLPVNRVTDTGWVSSRPSTDG